MIKHVFYIYLFMLMLNTGLDNCAPFIWSSPIFSDLFFYRSSGSWLMRYMNLNCQEEWWTACVWINGMSQFTAGWWSVCFWIDGTSQFTASWLIVCFWINGTSQCTAGWWRIWFWINLTIQFTSGWWSVCFGNACDLILKCIALFSFLSDIYTRYVWLQKKSRFDDPIPSWY